MKKNLLLLFCFFSITIFSQEYHFDYLIKERSVMLKPKLQEWMSTSFYDSANEVKLYLSVDQNNKTIATIYQRDKNVKHIFNVTKSADNLLFNYKYSSLFNYEMAKEYDTKDVIKVEKIDSLNYKITAYTNAKLKKKKTSIIITLEKSDFNYLKIDADYTRTEEMERKLKGMLDPDHQYVIKKSQTEYSSGYVFDEFIDIKKSDLTLKIPEKLLIREHKAFGE